MATDILFPNKRAVFVEGMRAGVPIAMGYFVVAFTLGIVARSAGITPWQGFFISLLNNASAGEYAAFTVIAANAPYMEMALLTLVANSRYLLMSTAMTQKFSPTTPLYHRLAIGFAVTDEFFGITAARAGYIHPYYNYGAMIVAMPAWAIGTMAGIIAGNTLPPAVISALSVALYGMFLWIIIPAGKNNRVIALLIAISFVSSYLFTVLPYVSELSAGTNTIILTLIIATAGAVFAPIKLEVATGDDNDTKMAQTDELTAGTPTDDTADNNSGTLNRKGRD